MDADHNKPIPIWRWEVVKVGTQTVHHSHNMYSYKGVKFCAVCGGYGVKRTTLLARECDRRCGNAPRAALVKRLFDKQRPCSLKGWPKLFQDGDNAEISEHDRSIICDVQNQINELSKATIMPMEVQEDAAPSEVNDVNVDPRPQNSCLDFEDEAFPCEEFSESD